MANISGMLEQFKIYTVLKNDGYPAMVKALEDYCGVSKESCHPSNKMWFLNKFSENRRVLGYADESKPLTEDQVQKGLNDKHWLVTYATLSRSDVFIEPELIKSLLEKENSPPGKQGTALYRLIKSKEAEWVSKWEAKTLKEKVRAHQEVDIRKLNAL